MKKIKSIKRHKIIQNIYNNSMTKYFRMWQTILLYSNIWYPSKISHNIVQSAFYQTTSSFRLNPFCWHGVFKSGSGRFFADSADRCLQLRIIRQQNKMLKQRPDIILMSFFCLLMSFFCLVGGQFCCRIYSN